jgi:Glycosyltransferase family 87
MGVCGAGCLAAAGAALRAVGAGPRRVWAALLVTGGSPLVLGSLFDTRFDLWPALLAILTVALVLHERPFAAGVSGGLAFAAKLWPVALAPLCLAYLWRRCGGRAAAVWAGSFAVAAALCFVPFAAVAPDGIRHSLTVQLDRPLQVESLGASILLVGEHLGGRAYLTVNSHGGQALAGSLPASVAAVSTAIELAAIVAVWLGFALTRRPGAEGLLLASAATLALLVGFGKVFSPQFLIWLVPFVPLVRGRRGLAGSLLLLLALLLTQGWFPDGYGKLAFDHRAVLCWLLFARNLAVVGLAAVLAWPRRLQDHALGEQRSRLEALQAIRR